MNHTIRYCLLFFLLPFQFIGQQNLILNGDFEEYWECPDDATQIERCKYVYNPLLQTLSNGLASTSDYFNVCYTNVLGGSPVDVPVNFDGYQFPFTGNGMIGFASYDNYEENIHQREYIELSFSKALVCGNTYHFEGYLNLANSYRYTLKGLGFYFSEIELNDENDFLYNLYNPEVIDTLTEVIDTLNWTKLTFDFVADKPYKFLSIGTLKSDSFSDYLDIDQFAGNQSYISYFYLDSVSLVQLKENVLEIPNVFTPNNDGVNDIFELNGEIKFIEKILFFNRWGNEVANLNYPFQWDGTIANEKEAADGVYYYIIDPNEGCVNDKQKQGMIHLIR